MVAQVRGLDVMEDGIGKMPACRQTGKMWETA